MCIHALVDRLMIYYRVRQKHRVDFDFHTDFDENCTRKNNAKQMYQPLLSMLDKPPLSIVKVPLTNNTYSVNSL